MCICVFVFVYVDNPAAMLERRVLEVSLGLEEQTWSVSSDELWALVQN